MPQTPATCSRAAGSVSDALAGQLVALLSVLAPALAVALAGDHGGTRAFAADIAGSQRDVDHRQAVLHAFRLVLQPAGVHQRSPARDLPIQCAAFSIASGGTPVISAAVRGSHACADSATSSKPVVYALDEVAVLQPVAQDDVQHAHQQRQVGARAAAADTDRHCA